jgi:hypothetical protein
VEEKDFNDKYWFPNTKVVKVVNPRDEDFVFQSTIETGIDITTGKMRTESRKYRVAAGASEKFPGTVANIYLDQVSKLIAQDDDKIQFIIDFALRAQYYDKLIVGVDDILNTYQDFPTYLDNPAQVAAEAPAEKAFPTISETETPAEAPKTAKAAKTEA